jgi:S1-C subfamily serine protease
MKALALVVVFLSASVVSANNRQWQDAKVVNITSDKAGAIVAPIGTMLVGVPITQIFYWIQTYDTTYVLGPVFTRHQTLNVTLNGKTKIAIDGRNAHVLDDGGNDRKLAVAEKIARPQAIPMNSGAQDPRLAALVADLRAKKDSTLLPKDIPAIARSASGSVVSIIMSDNAGRAIAGGSGFVISANGQIVTNYHVIQHGTVAIVKFPDGAFFAVDGILTFDKARDIAVIKAHGQGFRPLTLGDSDRLQVGEYVVAIGNPLSLESTVSNGIVSGIRGAETEGGKLLQITAPISHGSSGGPLFDMSGEVVGITTLYFTSGENLNFAIPINDVKALLQTGSPTLTDFPNDPLDESQQKTEAASTLLDSGPGTNGSSSEGLVEIHFMSDPDGAAISIDDAAVGKAPMSLKIKPGKHVIRMFMDHYQNWVEWITIENGPDVLVTATLEKSN